MTRSLLLVLLTSLSLPLACASDGQAPIQKPTRTQKPTPTRRTPLRSTPVETEGSRTVDQRLLDGWMAYPEGVKLAKFVAACEGGNKLGCNEAAWLMETGMDVKNRTAAKNLVEKGTCAYERQTFYTCILQGRVTPLKNACETGHARMCRMWGKTLLHLKKQKTVAVAAFSRACVLGDGPACRDAARIIEVDKTLSDADKDATERRLRERGCNLGEPSECWTLAQWHASGSHGYARNHDQYKELMTKMKSMDKASENRFTEVRRSIQGDALTRLATAREIWASTMKVKGKTYCVTHPTSKRSWVSGTRENGRASSWQGCKNDGKKKVCKRRKGPAPKSMESLFAACETVLRAPPANNEYGFRSRPDGALMYCYNSPVGSRGGGRNVSTSRVTFGECE